MSGCVDMQLTLGLSLKDDATFDNFYPGENAEMITGIKISGGR